MLVVCCGCFCLLLVVCRLLFVVCRLLFVVACWLSFVVCSLSLVVFVSYGSCAVRCLLVCSLLCLPLFAVLSLLCVV